ncbi:MAG: hypothetical protein LKJ90_09030 [Faecalibacterium sp.]|jgi:hypothetical protein|nr:hypothetical protein [Faecalibacterium sp.]
MKERKGISRGMLAAFLALAAAACVVMGQALCHTIRFEMAYNYTADSPLYWTVGRGILNGIMPYSGLYENKPVGIFLLSALSFRLGGNILFLNACCVAALFVLAAFPAVCTAEYLFAQRKSEKKPQAAAAVAALVVAALSGVLFMLYAEERAAQQTECIGAAWIVLYFWAAWHVRFDNIKEAARPAQIAWMALAAIFVICGVMMKEPFVLLAIFSMLLLVESRAQLLGRIVLPLGVGGCTAMLLLVATGAVGPYFTIYIRNMFSNHIAATGSPLTRGLHVEKLAGDLRAFSLVLLLVIVAALVLAAIPPHKASGRPTWQAWAWRLGCMAVAVYMASFAVGLGGQYYNHHYIFAAPLYLLAMALACRRISEGQRLVPMLLAGGCGAVLLVCLYARTNLPFAKTYVSPDDTRTYPEKYATIEAEAEYVDALLDYYGEDRYQFLGFNGEDQFYGLTQHSPLGPAFAQDSDNFTSADSWFSQQLLQEMNEANIVVMDHIVTPELGDQLDAILDGEFTTTPAQAYPGAVPDYFPFDIYYRTSVYGG